MAIEIDPITALPTPPSKSNPTDFAEKADTFLGALPTFQTETNDAITELNKITSGLDQQTAILAYNVSTTYDFPDVCAGSDGQTYRCIDTGVVGVDPTTDDGTYWVQVGGAGSGGLNWESAVQTTAFTAVAMNGYNVDLTSAAITVTLPLSPDVGDKVALKDVAGKADDFNMTIARNSEKIEGLTEDLVVDTAGWAGCLTYSGSTYGWVVIQSTPQTMIQTKPLFHAQHQETSGTSGGNSASASWTDRTLNTVITNEIAGASLATNEITLPAGDYWVEAQSHVFRTSYSRNAIRKSDNTELLRGINHYVIAAGDGQVVEVKGRLSLSTSTAIKISTHTYDAETSGFGSASGDGGNEVYSDIRIWQLDGTQIIPRVYQPVNQPVAGAYVTGGIFGGELSHVDDDSIDVAPFSCMDDTLTTEIAKASTTRMDFTSMSINEIYHIFAVIDGGVHGLDDDTDIDGANLPGTVTAKRWLGFVLTDASGDIINFKQNGDKYGFVRPKDTTVASVSSASYVSSSLTSFIPSGRIETVVMGADAGIALTEIVISLDGTDDYSTVSNLPIAAESEAFEAIPYQDTVWFRQTSGSSNVHIISVTLKR